MKITDLAKDLIYLMEVYNLNIMTDKQFTQSDIALLTNTKIQKILYAVMGIALRVGLTPRTLAINNENKMVSSIFDELPEAWPYGPVFKNIYKNYEQLNLESLSENYIPSYEKTENKNLIQQRDNEIMKTILESVVNSPFAKQKPSVLSDWSCKKGSPWDLTEKHQKYGVKINPTSIRDYFIDLKKEDIYELDMEVIDRKVAIIREKYLNKSLQANKNSIFIFF